MIKFFRYPRTRQEMAAASDAEDQGVTVRAKRNPNNLINAWDDIGREYSRSWKSQRKNQHR
jgi:hypothetical protein